MPVNGTEGGQITLAEGAVMTAEYRRLNPNGIKARLFGKDCLNTLLAQDSGACKGIRMYFAVNATGENELVLVGVDADGNDICRAPASVICPPSVPLTGIA